MKGERRFRRWATDAREAHADRVPTWEEIAHDYGRFLYTVCYRLTGNDHEAQDLVQEVLLQGPARVGDLPTGLDGGVAEPHRHQRLPRRRPSTEASAGRSAARRPRARARRRAPSADEALDNASLPDHVQQALRELPDDYRAAVVLCDVVGFSYQEIAESLDVPVGTVRSRIHRGRSLLKEALS